MNVCFEALDAHVVHGRASDVALVDGAGEWDFARLLEETAAIGGAMRGLGVTPGRRVVVDVTSPRTRLVASLAALRLGAVPVLDAAGPAGVGVPALLVADAAPDLTAAPAVLLDGGEVGVDDRDVPLRTALRAGRTDPAPLVEPLPGEPTYVVGEREVREPEADTDLGAALAALVAGRTVDLR